MPAATPPPVTVVDKGGYRLQEVTSASGKVYQVFTSDDNHGNPTSTVLAIQSISIWDSTIPHIVHIFEKYGSGGVLVTPNTAILVHPEVMYRAEYNGEVVRYASSPEQAIKDVLTVSMENATEECPFDPYPSVIEKYL